MEASESFPDVKKEESRSAEDLSITYGLKRGFGKQPPEFRQHDDDFQILEKITSTLQKDNECLLCEKKIMSGRIKELEDLLANREAKFSLVHSQEMIDIKKGSATHLEEIIKDLRASLEAKNKELQEVGPVRYALEDAKKLVVELNQDNLKKSEQIRRLKERLTGGTPSNIVGSDTTSDLAEMLRSKEREIILLQGKLEGKEEAEFEVQRLMDQIKSLNEHVRDLKAELKKKEVNDVSELIKSCQPAVDRSNTIAALNVKVAKLERALEDKDAATEQVISELKSSTAKLKESYEDQVSVLNGQLRTWERKFSFVEEFEKENTSCSIEEQEKARLVRIDLEKTVHKLEKEIKDISAERDHFQAMNRQLEQRFNEEMTETHKKAADNIFSLRRKYDEQISHLEELHQKRLKEFTGEVSYDQGELLTNLKYIENSGETSVFLLSVVDKLKYLERRCIEKEKQAASEVLEIKRIAYLEKEVMEQKMKLMINQKNQQINEFRTQLDQLILSLAAGQTHQIIR
ncbi:exonuclease SbcC [Angomonas deanei]|uniref:Uncharacterized protein n=1 Tax=Angomonas deanei TaxID=59799 RepID=A0A7G2CMT5_9TRYP|nr:exonuclease SbcC [Angomonas deanei]CAD2220735.1 hypothetical protein, conserved [Angomonas deanei]|eukprot:EPY19996.1 exonuclease SbcC [Angomonas deanei]